MRVAQQVRPRPRGERCLQPGKVEAPVVAATLERHLDQTTLDVLDDGEERRVHRRVDHHSVTRAGDQPQDVSNPGHHVGERKDPSRVDVPPETLGRVAGEGSGQLPDLGVAAVTAVDRRADRRGDGFGQGEVHLGHPRREHVRRIHPPFHAASAAELIEIDVVEFVESRVGDLMRRHGGTVLRTPAVPLSPCVSVRAGDRVSRPPLKRVREVADGREVTVMTPPWR